MTVLLDCIILLIFFDLMEKDIGSYTAADWNNHHHNAGICFNAMYIPVIYVAIQSYAYVHNWYLSNSISKKARDIHAHACIANKLSMHKMTTTFIIDFRMTLMLLRQLH